MVRQRTSPPTDKVVPPSPYRLVDFVALWRELEEIFLYSVLSEFYFNHIKQENGVYGAPTPLCWVFQADEIWGIRPPNPLDTQLRGSDPRSQAKYLISYRLCRALERVRGNIFIFCLCQNFISII